MEDISQKLVWFLMFIPILTIHEWAHAWAAHLLGDDTARDQGRLTINPAAHIDPVGTILIPLVSLLASPIALIGWGKPVPVDPGQLRSPRWGDTLVAFAGPLANFILAFITAVLMCLMPEDYWLLPLAQNFAFLSIFLGVFNLLPIPPLDGWHPIKNLFRIPESVAWMGGGFFWLIVLLVVINLPIVMRMLFAVSQIILMSYAWALAPFVGG